MNLESYLPCQHELMLYPSGSLWAIFASRISFVVLFLQYKLSFNLIARVIMLFTFYWFYVSFFFLPGSPLGRFAYSLEVTSQTVEMSAQHLIKKILKYRIHTLTVEVKLNFLTGCGLLKACTKKMALCHHFT